MGRWDAVNARKFQETGLTFKERCERDRLAILERMNREKNESEEKPDA